MSGPTSSSASPGINLGLARIQSLLKLLQSPEQHFCVVQVAGTNGKGSVSAMIDQILGCAGYKTGRFNSPHLVATHDGVRIDRVVVPADAYADTYRSVSQVDLDNGVGCSAFELQTTTAFVMFRNAGVEIAVVEVGVGGRLDATTACAPPAVCVFTAIGLDHVALLGGSLGAIAKEKAGIMRRGVGAAVFGRQDNPVVRAVLADRAKEVDCPVYDVDPVLAMPVDKDNVTTNATMARLVEYTYYGEKEQTLLPLLGQFQLENAATAIKAVEALTKVTPGRFSVTASVIQAALPQVRWPGRLEWTDLPIGPSPTSPPRRVLVDGAHNAPAARALGDFVHSIRNPNRNVTWVMAFTVGKDIPDVLKYLLHAGDSVYATVFSQPDQMPWINCVPAINLVATISKAFGGVRCIAVSEGVRECFRRIVSTNDGCGDQNTDLVVLCGSLYLVADLYRAFALPL
ncbi:Mur ligase [Powellomyces hirtus]|nr:Mur ligase [Powellomyces hirtus]